MSGQIDQSQHVISSDVAHAHPVPLSITTAGSRPAMIAASELTLPSRLRPRLHLRLTGTEGEDVATASRWAFDRQSLLCAKADVLGLYLI